MLFLVLTDEAVEKKKCWRNVQIDWRERKNRRKKKRKAIKLHLIYHRGLFASSAVCQSHREERVRTVNCRVSAHIEREREREPFFSHQQRNRARSIIHKRPVD